MQLSATQYKINGLQINATSKATTSGFAHIVNISGGTYGKAKVNYLNRTWESFTFQTAILKALNNAKQQTLKDIQDASDNDSKHYYLNILNNITLAYKEISDGKEPQTKTTIYIEY